jgi:hypothetical protein
MRRRRGALRRRYGHSGKMPLKVLEHRLHALKRVIAKRGGRV